jgi:hypothetical protein
MSEMMLAMQPSWNQADVFPVIASIIDQASKEQPGYVTHEQIRDRLLKCEETAPILQEAYQGRGGAFSLNWLAANMVAWFSQRITAGMSEWARCFERRRIKNRWAYRPTESNPRRQNSDEVGLCLPATRRAGDPG